jgi:RNA polymerase sigma-70 factor, ECF subfamily
VSGIQFNGKALQPHPWTSSAGCIKLNVNHRGWRKEDRGNKTNVLSILIRFCNLLDMREPNQPGRNGEESEPSSSATPRSLLEGIRAETPSAWERLVHLYAPLVLQWCQRWDLQEQDQADILQEVFQAVIAHVNQFRKQSPGDTFRGWLRTITQNKVRDHFRRLRREPAGEGGTDAQKRFSLLPMPLETEQVASGQDPAEGELFFRALELIRQEFEERTWLAFWRTAVEGRTPQDVAADLSMTPGAVRVAKCRVLHRLREELGDLMS